MKTTDNKPHTPPAWDDWDGPTLITSAVPEEKTSAPRLPELYYEMQDGEASGPEQDSHGEEELSESELAVLMHWLEEGEDGDEEFEDNALSRLCDEDDEDEKDEDVPGHRVILRSSFPSRNEYFRAVCRSIDGFVQEELEEPDAVIHDEDRIHVTSFDATTSGVDTDCFIMVFDDDKKSICVDYRLNVRVKPHRIPLLELYCSSTNVHLCYGRFTLKRSSRECHLRFNFCYEGAFSEAAFSQMFYSMRTSLVARAREIDRLSRGELNEKDREDAVSLLMDMAHHLPFRVKPAFKESYRRVLKALGGRPSYQIRKLLAFAVEHSSQAKTSPD